MAIVTKPVATIRHNFASTNVTSAAWVEIEDSTTKPCSAIEVFNPSGATLLIATGSSGNESELPYSILPGGSSILLPWGIAKNSRIALKSINATSATSGVFVLNLFA